MNRTPVALSGFIASGIGSVATMTIAGYLLLAATTGRWWYVPLAAAVALTTRGVVFAIQGRFHRPAGWPVSAADVERMRRHGATEAQVSAVRRGTF